MGAPLPALCGNCGRLFIAPQIFGVEGGGSVEVTLDNVSVGPCPYCSGMGEVPPGVYALTSNTASYLRSIPADDLLRLQAVLVQAQARGADAAEVAREITEAAPEAATLAAEVGKQSTASFQTWLVIVIALITLLLQGYSTFEDPRPALTERQMEQAMEQAIRDAGKPASTKPPVVLSPAKVGRNEPCPCGSGKKYKHCHGR
jgi:uncharacterized protein YecA (UPF0149 family)